MAGHEARTDRLPEVLRLAAVLAERVLDAQVMHRPVPDEQIRALATAALLLEDHGMTLPPLLMQVLHEVGADAEASDGDGRDPDVEKSRGLGWLLKPFQGSR